MIVCFQVRGDTYTSDEVIGMYKKEMDLEYPKIITNYHWWSCAASEDELEKFRCTLNSVTYFYPICAWKIKDKELK